MAKVKLGPTIGQASGSIGATVYSHNRYGNYVRNRTIPTKVTSPAAQTAKSRLAQASQHWATLTDAQRAAWIAWSATNPITDVLGDKQTLSGHAACVKLNTRVLILGGAMIDVPPVADPPDAFLTLVQAADIGVGSFGLTFTDALPANHTLWARSAVTDSAGITYITNLLKLVTVEAAAASPYDNQTDIEARFGTLAVGNVVTTWGYVATDANGLISPPMISSAVVVST